MTSNRFRGQANGTTSLTAISLLLAGACAQAAVLEDYGQFEISAHIGCSTGEYIQEYLIIPGSASFNSSAEATDAAFCGGGASAEASADVTIGPSQYSLDLLVSGSTDGDSTTDAHAGQWGGDRARFTLTESSTISVTGSVDIELFRGTGTGEDDANGYFYLWIFDADNYYEASATAPLQTGAWNWAIDDQFALPPGTYQVEGGISTYSSAPTSTHSGAMDVTMTFSSATPVDIDFLPGDEANVIDHKADVVIPVAVLSEVGLFDATQVAPLSVRFGPWKAPSVGVPVVEDVGGDSAPDLVFGFDTRVTGISCGDTSVTLEGETYTGEAVIGTDTIETVACTSVCHP
ncbi:MAG: hypothetical protein QF790_05285 [Gammaproteobacteria bacterium]|nr:hypothetical protein [Gammaproteobacteria bacterium]MDP6616559.1 hypothetical protein [Gammaproteobacteria bacterium]MDP6694192.1 hypothetical protein [Gammaproteobacteria bacterium]